MEATGEWEEMQNLLRDEIRGRACGERLREAGKSCLLKRDVDHLFWKGLGQEGGGERVIYSRTCPNQGSSSLCSCGIAVPLCICLPGHIVTLHRESGADRMR